MADQPGTPPTYAELAKDIAEGSFFDASLVPLRGMEVEVVGTEVLPNRFPPKSGEVQNPYQAIAQLNYPGARKPMRANAIQFIRACATLGISESGEIVGHKFTLFPGKPTPRGNASFIVGEVDGKEVPRGN